MTASTQTQAEVSLLLSCALNMNNETPARLLNSNEHMEENSIRSGKAVAAAAALGGNLKVTDDLAAASS